MANTRKLTVKDRLAVAAIRGMSDTVRSHLIQLNFALGDTDMEKAQAHWSAAVQDFAVLTEACSALEICA